MFKACKVQLKKLGRGNTAHHEEITEEDMKQLYTSETLNVNTPIGLQRKVFFEIMLYICRRGRENLRELTAEHFEIAKDSTGRRYLSQTTDELRKNRREDDNSPEGGRMYEIPGSDKCPIASFLKYTDKLNKKCPALFQRPKPFATDDDDCWYENAPVGKHKLGNMMPDIAEAAGLCTRYTNHCIRATCVSVLDECNHDARHIMSISLHKNESSIRSYSRKTHPNKKRQMSDDLSRALGLLPEQPTTTSAATCTPQSTTCTSSIATALVPAAAADSRHAVSDTASPPPANSMATDEDLDSVLKDIDFQLTPRSSNCLATLALPSASPQPAMDILPSLSLPVTGTRHSLSSSSSSSSFAPNIAHCANVTINYNMYNK